MFNDIVEAEKILKEIIDICEREQLWFTITKENKPCLKNAELKITFKIK
jgi:hypothetical protein